MDNKMILVIRRLRKLGYNDNDIVEMLSIAYNFGDFTALPLDVDVRLNTADTISNDYKEVCTKLRKK